MTVAQVRPGFKLCAECLEEKPLCEFKPSSGTCSHPCLKVRDNIYLACKAEELLEWYNEQRSCPMKWKRVKKWYMAQCPEDAKRMIGFKVLK